MVKLKVDKILEEKGKTIYWLCQQMDISYWNLSRMIKGETSSIRYDSINQLCNALNCTPAELFCYTPDEEI